MGLGLVCYGGKEEEEEEMALVMEGGGGREVGPLCRRRWEGGLRVEGGGYRIDK